MARYCDYSSFPFPGGTLNEHRHLQAGPELELALSDRLDRMGIANELTRGTDENLSSRVDLRVFRPPFDSRPPLEFQLTLRRGVRRKMTEFVLAARRATTHGIRVYLEVHASKFDKISYIAERVAWAIKGLLRSDDFWGEDLISGMRIRIGRQKRSPRLERFNLMDLVGETVNKVLEAERRLAEAMRREQLRLVRERVAKHRRERICFPIPRPTLASIQGMRWPKRRYIPDRRPIIYPRRLP